MATALQDKYDQRASVWSTMEEIKARGFTDAANREAWDKAEGEYDQLTNTIEEMEFEAKAGRKYDEAHAKLDRKAHEDPNSPEAEYHRAFTSFVRNGMLDMDPADRALMAQHSATIQNAQGTGTTAGGYTIPALFRDTIIETLKYYGPMIGEAELLVTDSGQNYPWPTNDDTANMGAILAENTQITAQDLTFGQGSLDAYMYTSKLVLVSLQLLQDSALDLDVFLPRKLAQRLGRVYNNHYTVGNGTGQPDGIMTSATSAATGTGSFASTGGIAYTNLVDVVESIDPAYAAEGNLKWMMHQSVRKAIRKLVDGQQRPIWEPSVQAGTPDLLLGYPVRVNNDMATLAASSKSLGFGNIRASYVARLVRDVQLMRLTERYADYLQVGFFAFQRADGTLQDSSAFKVFTTTSTA